MTTTRRFSVVLVVIAAILLSLIATKAEAAEAVTTKANSIKSNLIHNELLSKATLVEDHRILEENDDFYAIENAYSFTGYSLKYTKCQPVQYFSSDAIAAGEHSPMITEDIVLLRLCPSCGSSNSLGCHYNYADYAITVSEYVRILLKYDSIKHETACDYCQACGYVNQNDDNDGANRRNLEQEDNDDQQQQQNQNEDQQDQNEDDYYQEEQGDENNNNYEDCSMVDSICPNYTCDENDQQEENTYLNYEGYLDYLDCVQVDYNGYAYFVRPRCDGDSGSIKMAVFYDNYCGSYAGGEVSVKDLGLGFREGFFQNYYSGDCIDCSESNTAPFYNLNSALCNKIHGDAAKCTGNLLYDLFGEDVDSTECSYIESLRYGTYDSKGKLSSANGMIDWDTKVSKAQLLGLIFTSLFVVVFLIYACYLHHSMTNLLIKSLSHRELLPPSRHAKRPIV